YEIRPNRDAWGTSLVIHAWIIALLLFVPALKVIEDPPATPMELTLIDLGPAGDRIQGEDTRPAPKQVAAPVRQVREERPVEPIREPRPAAIKQALVPVSPPQERIRPVEEVQAPDLAALTAEEARRRAVEEQRRRELDEAGSKVAHSGTGTSDNPPPPGGSVGTGKGATGDLSGRRVVRIVEPNYPAAALTRRNEGIVKARIRVSPDGSVSEVAIVRSAGDPDIDQAAVSAFRRWQFSPLPEEAAQADQIGEVRMNFQLQ
ncbi:MAG: energy transducer TonB, partial [Candidatus Sericytochromatia bacterium]|nr:energy transducer TonB [Candidatus Tanganyikabacteria bacterium]